LTTKHDNLILRVPLSIFKLGELHQVVCGGDTRCFQAWKKGAGEFILYETLRVKRSYAAGFTPSPFFNSHA
ncbi:MAG: hypothetical protein ACYT04_38785, partial [Nostoc sp.]